MATINVNAPSNASIFAATTASTTGTLAASSNPAGGSGVPSLPPGAHPSPTSSLLPAADLNALRGGAGSSNLTLVVVKPGQPAADGRGAAPAGGPSGPEGGAAPTDDARARHRGPVRPFRLFRPILKAASQAGQAFFGMFTSIFDGIGRLFGGSGETAQKPGRPSGTSLTITA